MQCQMIAEASTVDYVDNRNKMTDDSFEYDFISESNSVSPLCECIDEKLSSVTSATSMHENANISNANVAVVDTLTFAKRREFAKTEVTYNLDCDLSCDLSVHACNVNRRIIDHVHEPLRELGYKTKSSGKSESANISCTDIAMFTQKRRETTKAKLTFDHNHTHFLHKHDNKWIRSHISKPLHESGNEKEVLRKISYGKDIEDFNEPDV